MSAGDSGQNLLKSLTNLCNFLLSGKLNSDIRPYFYGASLIGISKKDGGIGPIAIGITFRRLVAKLISFQVKTSCSEYLQPHQLGFGTPLGCENIIHSTRSFLNWNSHSNKILLKIDYKNAFNCVDRAVMLQAIKDKFPLFYPFIWQSYSQPTNLMFGSKIISSQSGCQQGDPLGPMLFSLALHPIIMQLSSELNLFYLDDGTLGGDPTTVLNDFRKLINISSTIGLEINPSKCEIFSCSTLSKDILNSFQDIAPGLKIISRSDLTILGSPVFLEAVPSIADQKLLQLETLFKSLTLLNPHVSYFVLKNCLLIPKFSYFMRTTPLWLFPSFLSQSDNLIRLNLESILNIKLNQTSWTQATLPIKFGGLGIRRLEDICLPSFLASSYGVLDFIKLNFSSYGADIEIPYLQEALTNWFTFSHASSPPLQPHIQKNWDDIITTQIFEKLLTISPSLSDQARLLALQEKESGSWLHAIPSPNIGTLLDSTTFKLSIALRLGCEICQTHTCVCGDVVDTFGHHALSCLKSKGRIPRHSAINDIIKRALTSLGTPAILEAPGIAVQMASDRMA